MEKIKLAVNKLSKKSEDPVLHSLELFKNETLELYLPKEVPVLPDVPTPLQFYKKFVATNMPVIIKGGVKHWAAVKKWNKQYLMEKLKNKLISVSVTPSGLADAIHEAVVDGKKQDTFVLPMERLMTIAEFYRELDAPGNRPDPESGKPGKVFYIQKQNSNLTEEFPELLPDIDEDLHWATESFDSGPVAINLWIGDDRAVSSLHKDPFENIYCVVSGYKDFILIPPTDRPWLPYKSLPIGQYEESESGDFDIKILHNAPSSCTVFNEKSDTSLGNVPWIDIDPLSPNINKYPLYSNATSLNAHVEAGDILYLPSLWFHHVRQSHKCIAVNYWYDMNFDIKYAYFQLLENLSKLLEKKPK